MKKWMLLTMAILGLVTPSVRADVPSGQPAPDFTLTDSNGQTHSLSQYQGKYIVLEWLNPECPFVRKHYDSQNMQGLQKEYTDKKVVWLSINSSAPGKQGHSTPEQANDIIVAESAHPSAVLLDPDGTVGRLYGAKTTPHIFIIDPQGALIYQGAIDDKASADPSDLAAATNYVRQTLDAAMAGQPVKVSSTKSYGCSVKY